MTFDEAVALLTFKLRAKPGRARGVAPGGRDLPVHLTRGERRRRSASAPEH